MARAYRRNHRVMLRAAVVAALVVGVSACEDAIGLGEHLDVAEVTLSIGSETVRLTGGAGASLDVPEGTHDVTAVARDTNGNRLGASIAITSSNQAVARYSALTGSLVTAPGTAQLTVAVMHGAHADFEQNITVNVH